MSDFLRRKKRLDLTPPILAAFMPQNTSSNPADNSEPRDAQTVARVLSESAVNIRSRAKRGRDVVPAWAAGDLADLLEEAAKLLQNPSAK